MYEKPKETSAANYRVKLRSDEWLCGI